MKPAISFSVADGTVESEPNRKHTLYAPRAAGDSPHHVKYISELPWCLPLNNLSEHNLAYETPLVTKSLT